MDPISGSCLSLNAVADVYESQVLSNPEEYFPKQGASSNSLGDYEKRTFKNLLPQIYAATITMSYHIVLGMSLAYSAILLPQLEERPEFELTRSAASWVASVITVTGAIGLLLVGFLMDRYGRLNTLKMAAVPGITGWCLMALSNNAAMLIAGRGLVGFACSLGTSPAVVYLTEIGRKDMRGSLMTFGPIYSSLGMILTFLFGWMVTWRTVAWICILFNILPVILLVTVPESPSWLIAKSRKDAARKSLDFLNRYQPPIDHATKLTDLQLALLEHEHEIKMAARSKRQNTSTLMHWEEFGKATFYKPLLILTGLFFFQQFSGIFVFLLYAVKFFRDVGTTNINPYLASMFIGVLRLAVCIFNTYSLQKFGRRNLIMISCVCMCGSVVACSLLVGKSAVLPALLLLAFKATSMIGLVPIPYTMTAELFPIEIRGVSHSVSVVTANFFMFLALQLYPAMFDCFGGVAGLLLFYGAVHVGAVVYVWIFLPETHEKTLKEIEDYLRNNVVYLGSNKRKTRDVGGKLRRNGKEKRRRSTSIVKMMRQNSRQNENDVIKEEEDDAMVEA